MVSPTAGGLLWRSGSSELPRDLTPWPFQAFFFLNTFTPYIFAKWKPISKWVMVQQNRSVLLLGSGQFLLRRSGVWLDVEQEAMEKSKERTLYQGVLARIPEHWLAMCVVGESTGWRVLSVHMNGRGESTTAFGWPRARTYSSSPQGLWPASLLTGHWGSITWAYCPSVLTSTWDVFL